MEKKRIFCDMDDTLCDFIGPFKSGEYKLKYPQSKVGFFLDLQPLEGAIEGMKTLQTKYNVYILTRPLVKGDYLIDDDNRHGQIEFEGEHIHFGKDERFKNWAQVVDYLMSK